MTIPLRGSLVAGLTALAALGAAPALAATCDEIAGLAIEGGTITGTEMVTGGTYTIAGGQGPVEHTDLPDFCRVSLTMAPSEASAIAVEVWLPAAESWNGRYLAMGNGGFAGSIGASGMIAPLRAGYVTSSTDTGHTVTDGSFGLDEDLLLDFAYRAVHEMARASKETIAAFYEAEAEQAYFSGCSTGGRQALTAALRYPDDFDGIIAGAAAISGARLHASQTWEGRVGHREDGALPSADDLVTLNQAALAQCDALDGVADNVIENPLTCTVDVAAAGFSGPVADTLQSLYNGPMTAAGDPIFPGLAPGSEAGWGQMLGPDPLFVAVDFYRYFVYGDASWSPETFDPEAAVADAAAVADIIGSESSDLSAFFANDGKLLLYHGWADPGISPYNSIDYYEAALANSGPEAADNMRLFMVPGMGHCGGGEGPTSFDSLAALDAWVSEGTAPQSIIASRIRDGEVDRTRPLCPYPQTAVYNGTGDTDDAASFICQ